MREITVSFILQLQKHMKYTLSKTKIKKTIIKRHSCLSFYRLYLCIKGRKFVIIETCAYDVAHDKNALSSLIIQII